MPIGQTYLDLLPIELFDEIFVYLTCNDILKSFYGINNHINQVVLQYPMYLVDLTSNSLTKKEFDLIYSKIDSNKIIKLKMGHDRYNVSNRFLLKNNAQQTLTNLRSLWINNNCQKEAFNLRLLDFNNLVSFRFDSISNLSSVDSNCLFEHLQYLVGCSSAHFRHMFKNIPSRLIFLHMFFNSFDDLHSFIDPNANQLKSLGIGFSSIYVDATRVISLFENYQWNNLIQLNLNLPKISVINFRGLKLMLSPMFKLKYLTLISTEKINISNEIFDGNHWQLFLSCKLIYLKKFNFQFPLDFNSNSGIEIRNRLQTFQTVWWLNEKEWFIEYSYEQRTILTIPTFSSKIFRNKYLQVIQWISNQRIYYLNISQLELDSRQLNLNLFCTDENQCYFPNVNTISLTGDLTDENFKILITNIDTYKIRHIKIISEEDNLENFARLINQATNLSSLDLQCKYIDNLFSLIEHPSHTIRHLVLFSYKINSIKKFFSDLYNLFPYLNYLTTEYFSKEYLYYLLNTFLYLQEMNLRLQKGEDTPSIQLIQKHTRMKYHSFQIKTTQINKKSEQSMFSIWINN